jgi:hypothetical protein
MAIYWTNDQIIDALPFASNTQVTLQPYFSM